MYKINWNQFMFKNPNPQTAFETICRNLFLREYKVSSHNFSSNYNQTGLETEPIFFEDKYYGFQCKYSESGNSTVLYKEVYESLYKAVNLYPQLNIIIVYTNLDIKPNVSEQELEESKETNRIKIRKLEKENNIEIRWFLKFNFEKALNDIKNYDLYRSFFSSQDLLGLLNDGLTHEDRTFLDSNHFLDLSLNGENFSVLKDDILSQNISIITGFAGTGKSEILKKLYLQCESKYLSNLEQVPSNNNTNIPIFIRLKECINGDLEGVLRNRLKDFDINIANNQNHYIYFFDGLDEISTFDFGNVITCIINLKNKNTSRAFIFTSRTNTANLTTFLRNFKPKIYKIDSLKNNEILDYFSSTNDQEKCLKLKEIKDNRPSFLENITDIFSVVLLNKHIFQIDNTTTKVDLIELNIKNLVESNQKYSLINLPEPKMMAIQEILCNVAEIMQRTNNISITRIDLQKIVSKLFPNCSYIQIDEIIDFISEMFFDFSPEEICQKRYSFRHKRYFEFFLYIFTKNAFYDNPAILRELRLLSNKDFIINLFLAQELKNNELNCNIQNVLTLRFLETYLGDEYFSDIEIPWQKTKNPLIFGVDSFLQSQNLRDYLCTKNINDFYDFIKNDPLSIKGFLTKENYFSFVKQYHKINGLDIREYLNEIYNIQDEWLEKAKEKDIDSFLYCKYVIDGESIIDAYDLVNSIKDVRINDLDHYPYNLNKSSFVINFFELAIEYFNDWLITIIDNLSINQLEVLSYVMLRNHNLRYIIKSDNELPPLAAAITDRINRDETKQYELHTVVLQSLLTDTIVQKEIIQLRADNVNIYHYETWRTNFELNSYVGMILGEEFIPYHYDYRLGIDLRKIVNGHCQNSKSDLLFSILLEINKYNFVCKNWFSYYNAIYIGEILASFDINFNDIKKFIVELTKYDNVVSTFQVLYVVMKRNAKLFKIIANSSLITSEYEKASQNISYYDYNADLEFMYATMISHFEIAKADALFEKAINNSIFRPLFRKEDIIDYHLPSCLLTAYNNHWLSNEDLEHYIKRIDAMLKIAKDTLDSGAYGEYLKYLVEQCCPQLSDIIQDINEEARNPEIDMEWKSYSSKLSVENVNFDNLSDYYACKIEGINYFSIFIWKQLINFELKKNNNLTILYQTLETQYFPGYRTTKLSSCFHVIIAALISNVETKQKALEFVMIHSGRMGLIHLIHAFALTGDDYSGRQYIEKLTKLCEAMVYPSNKHLETMKLIDDRKNKIIDIVCNSKVYDWEENHERCIMHYMKDPQISIRWDKYEEQVPFNEEWAINHPNKKAFSTRYYLYYQEQMIKSFDMVWVDGYRALIPMPNIRNNHIDRKSYNLACLINKNIDVLNRYILLSMLIVD